jgi:RNA-directed DNA polymerase
VISPLLANVALHGLEEALGIRRRKAGGITGPRALVRYADDFCVFCETKEDAQTAIEILTDWLAARGLALSPEKTHVVHLEEGFDFLGFTIKQYPSARSKAGYQVRITPSKASIKALRTKLGEGWKQHIGASVSAVLRALNPVIRGWANYFRIAIASKVFSALDNGMFLKAVRWVNRTHPHKPNAWRRDRYWGRLNPHRSDQWVFGNKAVGAYLLKFKWFKIERHVIVRGTASPDDPALRAYWAARSRAKASELTPSQRSIAARQRYVCPVCGQSLFTGEELQTHHLVPRAQGGTDAYTNLTLVHYFCHQRLHASAETDAPVAACGKAS